MWKYKEQITYEHPLFISLSKALVVMDFEKYEQKSHTVIQEVIIYLFFKIYSEKVS